MQAVLSTTLTRGIAAREARFPGRPVTMGVPNDYRVAEKSQQYHKHFLQYTHLIPKYLRLERGGAKLACCPGRHLTSLRP